MADPVVTSHHAIAPSADGATVTITVDGRELTATAGEFLIAAAERHGIFIPRFCYHPRLKPVGMCRMCLVEVSGPRGATLQPACYVPVADQMVVDTTSAKTRKAQDGVLEFLLVNHPLDCPVCDKGGECPLQDQTLAYGPGESRFVEEKRHFAKPIALSDLVLLDRERCIQCGRCTRFAAEIAGEAQIDFFGRGDSVEVAVAGSHVFTSVFSGNTVQICPVGALTATPYRFTARPWDLDQVESTCTTCAVGCRVAVQSSANRVTRLLGIDLDPVNQSWLCDKGRYGYEAVNAGDRLTTPLRRAAPGAEPTVVTWAEALAEVATRIEGARTKGGPEAVAFVGGGRLSNEDAYAWAKLAKGMIGTDSVDAQLGDGLPAEMVLGLPRATIDDLDRARAVVLLCGDLRDELPVLFLRLRAAAVDGGVPVVEVSAAPTSMSPHAVARLRPRPGEAAALIEQLAVGTTSDHVGGDIDTARTLLAATGRGEGVVVVVGRPSVAESADCTVDAVAALRRAWPGARFLPALRRGNVMGALDMGLAPGLLPGRVTLEAGGDWFRSAGWSAVPAGRGRDTAGILAAAAEGTVEVLVLVGADPAADFVDHGLATAALERVPYVVAVDSFASASTAYADVVLPVAMHHERTGTTTNVEGRLSRVGQKLVAPGQCWPDWMVAAEIAARMGGDLGVTSASELWDEIERLAPSHAGVTRAVLDGPAARDGVVVPLPAVGVAIRAGNGSEAGDRRIDPVATPGIESVERQGAPPRAGLAEPVGYEASTAVAEGSTAVRPSPVAWAAAPARGSQPVVGAPGSLRLVVRRPLYDDGVLVRAAPSLAALAAPTTLAVHPADLQRVGAPDGALVAVTSPRGRVRLPVHADDGIPTGTVVVHAGTPTEDGGVVGDLIGAGDRVVDVSLAVAT